MIKFQELQKEHFKFERYTFVLKTEKLERSHLEGWGRSDTFRLYGVFIHAGLGKSTYPTTLLWTSVGEGRA